MQQVIRIDLKIRKGTENPILFRFSVPFFACISPVSLYEFGAWESVDFRILSLYDQIAWERRML